MRIDDLIKMGFRNLSRRKARTLLTIVGVIIGTISIVVMVSIGIGMNRNFTNRVMEQGSLTTITVTTYVEFQDENNDYNSKEQKLTKELVDEISKIEHVKAVTPVIQKYAALHAGRYESGINLYGIDSSLFDEFEFPMTESGEKINFTSIDTIILGSEALNEFYYVGDGPFKTKEVNLAKEKITLDFSDYEILKGKKALREPITNFIKLEPTNNWEYDYSAYIDIEYLNLLYQKYAKSLKPEDRKKALTSLGEYQQIKINIDSVSNVGLVQEKIKELGFQSSSLMMYLKPMQEASKMLQMVLGAVGGVAMLVSAISIANTMIMSIYERTKEIGIMKVLGCVIVDIKKLFLFEAAMIGLFGGIIGIILSCAASWLINKFGGPLFQTLLLDGFMDGVENMKISIIPVWLPILAAGFTMVVGVISGYYPAQRATKISAIEAMKTEG